MAAYLTAHFPTCFGAVSVSPPSAFISLAPLKDWDWISAGISGCKVSYDAWILYMAMFLVKTSGLPLHKPVCS